MKLVIPELVRLSLEHNSHLSIYAVFVFDVSSRPTNDSYTYYIYTTRSQSTRKKGMSLIGVLIVHSFVSRIHNHFTRGGISTTMPTIDDAIVTVHFKHTPHPTHQNIFCSPSF